MPTPILTPRINNNDDSVRLSRVLVPIGSEVKSGDPIVDVETDKATFTVESDRDGFLIAVSGSAGEMVEVGSVLAWIGSRPDEAVELRMKGTAGSQSKEPTLKALLLLKQYGLNAGDVPISGARLTAADVESYNRSREIQTAAAGHIVPLGPVERAMARTVAWQRDEAVPGYVEISFDASAWETYAQEFQKRHNLLLSPLLPLMCWRLARLAAESPCINATIVAEGACRYNAVNLGFTCRPVRASTESFYGRPARWKKPISSSNSDACSGRL
jgi:pyruvate/2-oxoglutarate dehydrogenase complex dihydrolipoamide acyltransferase (E2) component